MSAAAAPVAPVQTHGGWSLTMWAGPGLPVLALACFLTERPENPLDGDRP